MSDNLKNQYLKITNVENFFQNKKFDVFVILFVKERMKTFQPISNSFLLRDCQTFDYSTFE